MPIKSIDLGGIFRFLGFFTEGCKRLLVSTFPKKIPHFHVQLSAKWLAYKTRQRIHAELKLVVRFLPTDEGIYLHIARWTIAEKVHIAANLVQQTNDFWVKVAVCDEHFGFLIVKTHLPAEAETRFFHRFVSPCANAETLRIRISFATNGCRTA